MNRIVLDIETLDWFNQPGWEHLLRIVQIERMRCGVAVTLGPDQDVCVWEPTPLFGTAALVNWLISQDDALIVGWNIVQFDFEIIASNAAIASVDARWDAWQQMTTNRTCDLMLEIIEATEQAGYTSTRHGTDGGRWYSLDTVARANLGRGKTANGLQACEWLRSGDPALVQQAVEYCIEDVQLTADLYALACSPGLLLPAREERGEMGDVRFSWDENAMKGLVTR